MPQLSYGQSLGSINRSVVRSGDGAIDREIALPAGKPVTAWVKTDANTAACNLPAGHGQTDGNFDVYWSAGGVNYSRYNVPGTIVTNALTLDGGAGTDFPASATTGVVVCKQVTFNATIDGDELEILGVLYEVPSETGLGCRIQLLDGSANVIAAHNLANNVPVITDVAAGQTNPYTGAIITNGKASNSDTTYDAVLKIKGIEDATP